MEFGHERGIGGKCLLGSIGMIIHGVLIWHIYDVKSFLEVLYGRDVFYYHCILNNYTIKYYNVQIVFQWLQFPNYQTQGWG